MTLIFIKPTSAVKLVVEWNRDYHIDAMVKMLRLVGHMVVDERKGSERVLVVQPLASLSK